MPFSCFVGVVVPPFPANFLVQTVSTDIKRMQRIVIEKQLKLINMIAGVGKSQTNLFVHTCVIFSHIVRFDSGTS